MTLKALLLPFIFTLFIACSMEDKAHISTKIELNTKWNFSQEGSNKFYPATVPGVVHLDLLENQLIEDPYWENNEEKLQWVENENWIYICRFQIDKKTLENQHVELKFMGLDTYARIFLNGKEILFADNMFREWDIEVKENLKEGENELKIVFQSPITYNQEKVENYPFVLPSGNETAGIETKVSAFTRKAAYHFGWDWAPRFVSSGIWRPVYLTTWNEARILEVFTSTNESNSTIALMNTRIEIEADKAGEYILEIDGIEKTYQLNKGNQSIDYSFQIKDPHLWWTNGLGEAYLYQQNLKIKKENHLLDEKSIHYGVRTIELINTDDKIGTAFYFKLNGKPVFMQGANYVPQDLFLPRVKEEQYKRLIKDAKEANMNMLRVWGGGIYENDLFYDLCDQNGILVWQDFMFAGSLYPDDTEFLENVRQEVIQNVKRLRSHPSIAVWCGNNEIEVAWNHWGWQEQYQYSPDDSLKIWNNYQLMFQNLIPELLFDLDPSANYTSTTPLSNWGTSENFNHSSMHYWGVWHGKEPFENFEEYVGRFMVEYGFQSFPSLSTLKKVMADSSLYLHSLAMQNRQKSYIGNGLIEAHIKQYFNEPTSFEEFIDRSQETQAIALGMAIRAHKAKQPHCMGTLFWQLNDCWPGPSWSVIDYYGKHKKAYDTVKIEFTTQQ